MKFTRRFSSILSSLICVATLLIISDCVAKDVAIETSSGQVVVGQFAGTADSVVRLQDGSTIREFPVDQIVTLRPNTPVETATGPPMNVTLVDGTTILAQDVSMDETNVTIEPRRQAVIEIPIEQVRSIRFRLGTAATDPQWLGLLDKESRSDLMVIRRGNDQLDPIEGVIVAMDAANLVFELDGDKIEAPRDRLEGVLFRAAASDGTGANVKVIDIFGSIYLANRLEPSPANDEVVVLLPGQTPHRIPIDQVKAISWSSGRVMLANEPPASSEMATYLDTQLPESLVKDWFGPIAVGEDLVAAAGGRIDYRVAEGFQTLAGSVGRDERVAVGAAVVVRVLVDEELKWEHTLTDSSLKGFRIPVAAARRVRLEVLATDDGDVGDQVRFLKPRLLK